jgi:thioredoxin-related protein
LIKPTNNQAGSGRLPNVMKIYSLFVCCFLMAVRSMAQSAVPLLYDPSADAAADISRAVSEAKAEHKHVLLQAGGNWCSWCIEFDRFLHTHASLDSLAGKCFVIYHLNYSRENMNAPIFARYGYPQRFGFPVFIILDQNGNRIHTQNSEYLEQGKSYSEQRVMDFLLQWTPQALDPALYK